MLTKSLEESKAKRIAEIKKKHEDTLEKMRHDLEIEETKLEEEVRRELALEMDTNKAHIVDNKDRHWILAEFDLDQQNIETRIKQSQREQMSRLENKLFERRATKAKVTELMRQDLNNKIEKELDLVMKMNIHEFILE